MNRKQQTKCVVGIYKLRIFHMSSALFSVIRGLESLQLNLLRLEVLASRPQSCAPFSALPGLVSPFISFSVGSSPSSFTLDQHWPKVPLLPLCLSWLAIPFSARVAVFSSLLTSSSDSHFYMKVPVDSPFQSANTTKLTGRPALFLLFF